MTPYIIQPNGNNANDLVTHIWYWGRFVANIAKTKPQQQQMILQFSLLISYKLHLFFKMSNNNLFKTCFGFEKYWFFSWKISNLKMTFLSKNPVWSENYYFCIGYHNVNLIKCLKTMKTYLWPPAEVGHICSTKWTSVIQILATFSFLWNLVNIWTRFYVVP